MAEFLHQLEDASGAGEIHAAAHAQILGPADGANGVAVEIPAFVFRVRGRMHKAPAAIDEHGVARHTGETGGHVHVVKATGIGPEAFDGSRAGEGVVHGFNTFATRSGSPISAHAEQHGEVKVFNAEPV